MFPIKYMENNLVFNQEGECFAYYELVPYNYSFLSPEQKMQLQDSFRQLVAQSRDGRIHALQLAAEHSIRSVQEQCKKEIRGELRETAEQIIDEQTEALVDVIGENQIDYRFFLGFKLQVTEQEFSLRNVGKNIYLTITEFIREVSHSIMGDFVRMDNDEIERFQKVEKLLEDKIARRFKVKRVNKNDLGYIIEHIYGMTGMDYEAYEYYLPTVKLPEATLVKKYDLIKPIRCLVTERQRFLEIDREERKRYVTYFTINEIVRELDQFSSEMFYYQQSQLTFPVDTSMNIEVVANKKALFTVRNKKKELKDLDDHAYSSNNETSNQVVDALESVDQLEADLDQTKEPMYKLSYVVRVWADGLEELQRRCDAIRDFYDDSNIKLVRPFGDMLGLHGEFIPASRRYEDDYVQYVTSDFIAGLGFGATQELGNTSGFYMGYNSSTGKNVYLNPKLAAQGVSGSVTNALAMSFTGSLGSGKSLAFNLMAYYSVLFGAKVLIIDPKSERGGWKKDLPNIAEKINIVNLTSDDCNKGLLDPFVIMQDINDAKMLAADLLTFLTGIQAQDGEKFPVLWDAIRTVAESDKRGLLCVIDELRKDERRIAQTLADHIDSFANYSIAQLLFSDGTIKQSVSLENQLNVIQVADLVLPDENVPVKEYTMTETLSVAMMIALSTFALSFIKSDNKIFKIVGLDEAWSFLRVAQGKTLANKLIREGRSMNASVVFITQNTNDLSDEKMKNNIGLKFAFRSRDIAEIKNTLEYLGLDKEDEGLQKQLRNLENGQCMHQDLYGRTGIMQVDVMFSWIFHAFDSRPPMEEVEE